MRPAVHTLSNEAVAAAMQRHPSDAIRLEHAWRTLRTDRPAGIAAADRLIRTEDPEVAVAAAAMRVALTVRGGAPLPPERTVDESVLPPIWALRVHTAYHSAALSRFMQPEADEHYGSLIRLFDALAEEAPLVDTAWIANGRGRQAYRKRDLVGARQHFVTAVKQSRRLGNAPSTAVCLTNLGNVLSDLGDLPGALEAYTNALAILTGDPQSRYASALAHANIALVRGRLGDHDEARRYAEIALDGFTEEDGPAAAVNTLSILATIELEAGRIDAAETCLDRAAARFDGIPSDTLLSSVVRGRAAVLAARGDPEAGLALLDGLPEATDPRTPAYELHVRARLLDQLGRHDNVIALLADAAAEIRTLAPSNATPSTEVLVRAYEATGQLDRALATLRDHMEWSDARHETLLQMRAADRAVELDLVAADARERAARVNAESMQRQLIRAQRLEAVGQLASGIAHDFNNLLTVVLGEAEAIVEHSDATDDIRESAGYVFDAAQRGRTVTKRLLAFARQLPTSPGPVDLNEAIQAVHGMLKTASGSGIELVVTPAPHKVVVNADVGLLEQMVLNLVLNARDAMPTGGRIEIGVGDTEHTGVVSVADTGPGIPPEVLPRIFDPFFTTKGIDEGTGLGLAMVYGGMEQVGGSVDVESTPGAGTTFTLRFSRAPDSDRAPV